MKELIKLFENASVKDLIVYLLIAAIVIRIIIEIIFKRDRDDE